LFDFSNIQITHWLYWGPWLLLGFGMIGTTSLPQRSCVSAGEYAP
jgi:hypothetical protein